ncbi:SAM-dependent methyltransferase [Micromonospora rifamycinica]|uniref:SAM-dependent methyltransferase n=1 Tax=Micromonospora rifamycinica TaxID=291594 RepID=UPI001E4C4139|nr:SAM-dependent methyltransferase [Micromonospora rifamycinica]
MADVVVAPVVPPVVLAGRGNSGGRSDRGLRRRPLPLADLSSPRVGTLVYGVAALDASGRIADSGVVRALGWVPGTRLQHPWGCVLCTDRQCIFTVTGGQGHLRLATARVVHGGDSLLADALPELQADVVVANFPFGIHDWGHDRPTYDPRSALLRRGSGIGLR